ncbi:MAG TPA: PQQ-binding-like beta-propeller repeat protein [Gemmataceae bacterium]|nr:PQQ-binding-like beta-propeller repeat protein [Gemmataceae bacterium]
MSNPTHLFATLLLFIAGASSLVASDWPGFRGAHNGASEDKNLPVKWNSETLLWKIKLPGAGTSSPIITGDKLIVTCNAGYGTTITKGMSGGFGGGKGKGGKGGFGKGGDAGDQSKLQLLVMCIDRNKADILWKKDIKPKLPETPFSGMMREHSYASSTPVTDGKNIYAFFGKSGVYAFDLDGKELWSASVGTEKHMWGSAASPVLYKDLVIVNAAIESKSLVALDKKTGKEVWRQRGMGTTWASPILVETKDGKHEVVINVPGKIAGYDPQTGKELWHCQGVVGGSKGGGGGGGFGGGSYTASTPVARDGIVYVIGGGGPTPTAAMAIKTGGRGDVSKTHVLWKSKAGACNCSPVLAGDFLYWVDGTITCLNIADGKTVYKERLYGGKNEYVSAVAAGDKIYALTRFDGLFVVSAGNNFEQLAHNNFKGDTSIFNASPAISDGRIYLRSNEYLYCIGKK